MTPFLRRLRGRLVWISAVALLLAFTGLALNQWVYSYSDDQCTWRVEPVPGSPKGPDGQPLRRVMIREVLPNGVAEDAGLLEGDELLAIQGRKVEATNEGQQWAQRFINGKPEGTILLYTIRREGQSRALVLPVRLVKPLNSFQILLLINGILAWAIALLVVVSNPERKSSRHFFYLGSLMLLGSSAPAGGTLGNFPLAALILVALPGILAGSLLMPAFLHFLLRFPHPFPQRRNPRLLLSLYLPFLVMGLLNGLGFIVASQQVEVFRALGFDRVPRAFNQALGLVGFTQLCLNVVGGLLAAGIFLHALRRIPETRRKGLLAPLFFTIAIFVDLLAYTVMGFQSQGSLVFRRQSYLFLVPVPLVPLSFGYAVIRHGLFDVKRALLRWVSYLAILGAALVGYLGATAWGFAHGLQGLSPGWAGLVMALSALPVAGLFRMTVRLIRRRFHRDLASAREIVLGALRESRRRLSEDALLKGLTQAIQEAFQPQGIHLLRVEQGRILLPEVDRDGDPERPTHFPAAHLVLPGSVVRHAREDRELVLGLGTDEADWIRSQDDRLRAHVDALEVQVMVLVMVHEEPYLALLLGGKYAELNYGRSDRELLREAAIATGIVLETAALHKKLLAQERLSQEMATARHIQEGLVTAEPPATPGFQVALRLEPALETGGDLLFVKQRPSSGLGGPRWVAAVGDVSGKGLAAALYMAQATALLDMAVQQEDQPLEALVRALDETMRHLLGPREFLTLSVLEWDASGAYRLARAGHPPALLLADGRTTALQPHGRGLGLRPPSAGNWEVAEGILPPRGWIALYSDGLTEAMGRTGELYGTARLSAQLQKLWGTGSVRAACEAVFRDVAGFEAQNRDDRTLFILGREDA